MTMRYRAWVLALALVATGCSLRELAGLAPASQPTVNIKSAEARWLLVQNPRFGDVPSEPEYIWVEEDKVPTSLKTLIRGKRSIIAPPEVVSQYGSPPGGGKISPRQGLPYQVAGERDRASARTKSPAPKTAAAAPVAAAEPADAPKRGYVVWADTTRIVIDLTSQDGVKPGSVVSLRRDKIPIVHPVTGELLGELDEEVATARITETREKFSVAEIQTLTPGSQVEVRDRVVPK
jgi:hypothetical protein